MKRRHFLLLPGVMAMAWNQALANVETPSIGFVHPGSRQENHALLVAFHDGLSALGWTDGSNLSVIDRRAEERIEALPAIVKELIGSGATILVTAGTQATLAATRANATIPIVLVGVDDPASLGLVDTLMQPGGNVTGLSLSSSEVIAERMGIETLMLQATTAKAVELAFARLRSDRAKAIYVASGPLGPVKRAWIIALAEDSRLPVIYSFRIFAIEGGLISFAADYGDLFRRAAGYVDKILKGSHPADLPVEPPRKFGLIINLNAARSLDLKIPPAILARADEVIDQTTEIDRS